MLYMHMQCIYILRHFSGCMFDTHVANNNSRPGKALRVRERERERDREAEAEADRQFKAELYTKSLLLFPDMCR